MIAVSVSPGDSPVSHRKEGGLCPTPADAARLAFARALYRNVARHRSARAAARSWPEVVFARRALALAEEELRLALDALLGQEVTRG